MKKNLIIFILLICLFFPIKINAVSNQVAVTKMYTTTKVNVR